MTLLDFWPTNEAVNACMPSEAEAISPAAFLAVHQPIRLRRRSLGNPSAPPEPADEQAVLDALLTPHLPEGYVVVPVVGRPGVGKSHLITWLGLHVAGERRVVVTIPKSTSLRKILEDILGRLTGGEYDDVRRRLATSQDALDDIAAEEKLLAEFRIALRRKRDEAKKACDEAKQSGRAVPPDQRAIAETHGDGLIALLEGPTKEALLTGTGGRSVFRSLIRRVRTGKIDAENGQFTAADLNLDPVKLKLADGPALKYLKKLKANVLNEREAAAGLLNAVRDKAVELLLGLGENQLADLFRRVRMQLLADGKELVLLIEDFTTLAGVQGGLLDVMKMEGVQKGKTVLCPLRTALAVTDGFLTEYGTVTSRVGYDFVLREQPAGDAEVLGTITDLVGAYLNAARIGADQLTAWFESKNGDPNAPPPSFEKAAEGLTATERTQLEAFGKSSRGHSLFPFNREAVRHLADQHLRAEGGLRLNPRDLIKHVLQPTLRHDRDTFERKQFPPDGFHSFNPNQLGPDVTRWVDGVRKADAPRYKVLLGFWGDRPKAKDDVRLPGGVYTAFGLTPLTDVAPVPPPVGPVAPPPVAPPVVPPIEPTEDDKLRERVAARVRVFDEWATTRKISQPDARSLRIDLLDMIGAAIDWDAELLAGTRDLTTRTGKATTTADDDNEDEFDPTEGKGVEKRFPPEKFRTAVASDRVYLPFTGSKTADADDACFVLCREEEFDTSAFADVRSELLALVRFHTYKSFDYDGGDEDRGWYAGLAERATRQAREYIRKRYERVPDDEAAAAAVAQALYVSARVLNLDGAHSAQDADVVAAVLHPGPGGFPPKPDDPWHGFRQACAANRTTARDFLLRRLAARQGGGWVLYAIDAARLLKWIQPVRKSCRVEVEFPGAAINLDDNARQVRGFVTEVGAKRTESAVGTRRDALRKWADTTRTWLGSPFDKKAFVGECRGLLTQANNLGVFGGEVGIDTLRQHLKEFDEAAVSDAIGAVDKLKDAAAASVVLTAVVQAPDDAVRKADTFRTGFQRFVELTAAAAQAEMGKRLKLAGGDATADPPSLLPAEGRKLDADLRAILFACGSQPAELPAAAAVETTTEAAAGRFADLAAVLDRLSRVDTVAQQLKEMEPPRSAVNGWATELTALVKQHQVFGTRGGVSIDPAPKADGLVKAAEAARTAVARSPLDITKGRTFSNLKAAVEKVVTAYQTTVTTAWQGWVDRTAPRVTEGELTPFEKHEDYSGVVTQIRTKLATLKRSRTESAEKADDFSQVEETAAALRALLGQLPTEAPAVVKAFLAATNAKDGAPLDLLTPEVLAWLRANHQLDKYRIWR